MLLHILYIYRIIDGGDDDRFKEGRHYRRYIRLINSVKLGFFFASKKEGVIVDIFV